MAITTIAIAMITGHILFDGCFPLTAADFAAGGQGIKLANGLAAMDSKQRRFPPPWTTFYFSILIVRVVVAPRFLQV